jgi:hypothetical protein
VPDVVIDLGVGIALSVATEERGAIGAFAPGTNRPIFSDASSR